MPFVKGNPGKPKGSKNKRTLAVEETAERLGVNIFEILCLFAKGDWKALGYEAECYFSEGPEGATKMGYVVSPELRQKSAESAAKYLYTQKRAVEHSAEADLGFKVIVEDYTNKK